MVLIDIYIGRKKVFIFELTKKEIEENSEYDNYLIFHNERKFRFDRIIKGIGDFYEKITVGDIIELHQLPKSEEFIKIQKIENTPKNL